MCPCLAVVWSRTGMAFLFSPPTRMLLILLPLTSICCPPIRVLQMVDQLSVSVNQIAMVSGNNSMYTCIRFVMCLYIPCMHSSHAYMYMYVVCTCTRVNVRVHVECSFSLSLSLPLPLSLSQKWV